ncbi:hypothetical protein FSO04_18715 [Paraburkholderia madseniana]|uniref:Uncharacterized protein n=1 Tax=Paraburkholderia madseniana TaxID=2599607 RepID=A0A6N6WF59_9BURK|nr:hypothetical protein [Paraburkholderia madseniana]KAE8758424.1 hypothetical protein FSO04_18715 [Paraburkholderia madseniana]
MHPTEQQWIKDNAKTFAQLMNGGNPPSDAQVAVAQEELAQQAFRQVQNGVSGQWDEAASEFLSQAHAMLPADPNCPSCGPGYMFQATAAQKANANMYASYLPQNGINNFYAQNGLSQPTASQISNSANRDQKINNLMGGGVLAAATGGALLVGAPVAAAVGGLGFAAIGATAGGGMDAAGQYAQSGTIRPAETAFATATGAVGGPIGANVKFISSVLLGAATNSINTAFNNTYYGESNSLSYAAGVGALAASGGYLVGAVTTKGLAQIVSPYVYDNLNPAIPALLQPRSPNLIPGLAGAVTGSTITGTGSLVPSKEAPK